MGWMTSNYFSRDCDIVGKQQGAWAEDTSVRGIMNQIWNSVHEEREALLWILIKQLSRCPIRARSVSDFFEME